MLPNTSQLYIMDVMRHSTDTKGLRGVREFSTKSQTFLAGSITTRGRGDRMDDDPAGLKIDAAATHRGCHT